jgi:hypothetical protein
VGDLDGISGEELDSGEAIAARTRGSLATPVYAPAMIDYNASTTVVG